MGHADKQARELIDLVEDGGAPAGGHLGALTAVARDAVVKRGRRRRAVELIAAIQGREAVAVAAVLTLEPWMDERTQERVVKSLLGRGVLTTVVPMLASGGLEGRAYDHGIQHLAGMPPDDLVAVLVPFVSAPGPCNGPALLGLMRLLAASGDEGATAVAALASDPRVVRLVRVEAGYALERLGLDRLARSKQLGALEAEEHTLTFFASRFRAESFEQDLRSYAEGSGIPYRATIGEGRLWREVTVTVTARPATVADLAHHARAIGRFRGDWGGPGPGGPWNSGEGFGDLGSWGDFGGGGDGGGGGGGGDGGGGGG